jgi:dihydroflavonol-4-reductase
MKALVLGATGFIGAHIVRHCLAAGIDVRGMRRINSSFRALEGLDVEMVVGDVTDKRSLVSAMKGCDVVFHSAGYYPPSSRKPVAGVRQAMLQMRNVLDAAAETKVSKVIYTSSTSIVLPPPGSDRPANENDYYLPGPKDHLQLRAKWAQEQEIFRYVAHGVPVVILNVAACYGPGDAKPLMGTLLVAVAKGVVKVWVEAKANLVDVRDVAAVHISAIEHGRVGERYVIGGENMSAREVLTIMAEEAGVPPPRIRVPLSVALAFSRPLEYSLHLVLPRLIRGGTVRRVPTYLLDLVRHPQYFDSSKAIRELGLKQSPLRQAVRDGLDWYREHGYI